MIDRRYYLILIIMKQSDTSHFIGLFGVRIKYGFRVFVQKLITFRQVIPIPRSSSWHMSIEINRYFTLCLNEQQQVNNTMTNTVPAFIKGYASYNSNLFR